MMPSRPTRFRSAFLPLGVRWRRTRRLSLPAPLLFLPLLLCLPRPAWALPEQLLRMTAWEDQRVSGDELRALFHHPQAEIRSRAALAAGRIGRAEDVPPLAELLRDPDPGVRGEAAFALGEIEDTTAAPALLEMLLKREEAVPRVRMLILEALGKLRRGREGVLEGLGDPDARVRSTALLWAWRIPRIGCLDRAITLTSDPDAEVRFAASYCLIRLLGVATSGRTAIPGVAPLDDAARRHAKECLLGLASDPEVRVRLQVARGLSAFADAQSARALLTLAADSDWRVRVEALRSLATRSARAAEAAGKAPSGGGSGRAGGPAVPWTTLQALLDDRNGNVRVTAVEALADLGDDRDVLPRLRRLARDAHPRVAQVARLTLLSRWRGQRSSGGRAAGDSIEAAARRWLRSSDWPVRVLAADAAALLPDDRAEPILRQMARDEPRVAKAAVEPLLRISSRGSAAEGFVRLRGEMEEFMVRRDPVVRALAVGAAGEILSDSSFTTLGSAWEGFEQDLEKAYLSSRIRDATPDVRQSVVEAASRFADRPGMLRLLTLACSDSSYLVRRAAVAAMRRTGQAVPREAEPVRTGRKPEDYEAVLQWAEHDHWAIVETDGGRIVLRLFTRDAPLTCWNFASLAASGFYDGGLWHRVVPDFVLQDGCDRGDGYGGSPREIRCEINHRRYVAGTLGMALSGKDTGTSQFFITHSDQPHLDGRYTVFGRVESGLDLAGEITQGSPIHSIRVVDERPAGP